MSSPLKKVSLNAPPEIYAMMKTRIEELPYRSESDYLMALVLTDCRFRYPHAHAFGARVLNQSAQRRDADLRTIIKDFPRGARPMDEADLAAAAASVFTDYFQKLPVRLNQISATDKPVKKPRQSRRR